MNLATANPRTIATLILHGKLEIGEVPTGARHRVTKAIDELKAERIAEETPEAAIAEVKEPPPVDSKLTVAQIKTLLDDAGIEYSTRAKKADLIALLPA